MNCTYDGNAPSGGLAPQARRKPHEVRAAPCLAHDPTASSTRPARRRKIAEVQSSSGQVVNDWMNSSGHRANILNGGHRKIGVARKVGRNGAAATGVSSSAPDSSCIF